jgi:hypothetical protein
MLALKEELTIALSLWWKKRDHFIDLSRATPVSNANIPGS